MTKILFLCSRNACRSQMAEGFARARAEKGVAVFSAGTEATVVNTLAIRVMKEVGVDISSQASKTVQDLGSHVFDAVITLCSEAAESCPILPGYPEQVHWNLEDPDVSTGDEKTVLDTFRKSRDEIHRLVDDFFDRGYLRALVEAKSCADVIIDNISDGIIAHDMGRRIFFFNKAAEKITGYKRDEVLEKDCHDVFPGKFCGGKCRFCDGSAPLHDSAQQEMDIITKSGERRSLKMNLKMMLDMSDHERGVLATFRDTTREKELSRRVGEMDRFSGIIGRDKKMVEMFELIRDLADSTVPVLIQGASGTGKELVAAAIHNEGSRANQLFVPVNCGALPESLLESELFGHVKGAFTGAIRDKKGRFELADGGTIFLDEIGDIPQSMQVKLLRVLQEGTFERVGSEKTIKVDVRLISATNKNLFDEMEAGRFREDLYYRMNVVPIFLPPLMDRRNDIPLLVDHILKREIERSGKTNMTISHEALEIMMSYDWPGNVRELQNWIQFAMVKCKDRVILSEHLPPKKGFVSVAQEPDRKRKKRKLDILAVRAAISECRGNKLEAAKLLGVSRATLYRFLEESGEM